MRLMRSLAMTALATVALGSCSMIDTFKGPEPTNAPPMMPKAIDLSKGSLSFPTDRTFVAVSYKDQAFKGDRPTLLISANYRGTGYSACNNWSATIYPRGDQRMAVGPVAVSKRKCEGRLMHNEQVFLYVLRTAQSWKFDGVTLTLAGPYGTMTFRPAA